MIKFMKKSDVDRLVNKALETSYNYYLDSLRKFKIEVPTLSFEQYIKNLNKYAKEINK